MPLNPVDIKYTLPTGEKVTMQELQARLAKGEIDYGVFQGFAPGVGDVMSLLFPPPYGMSKADTAELVKIIEIIDKQDFSPQRKEDLKIIFKNSAFLRSYLFDLLLPRSLFVSQNLLHYKLNFLSKDKIRVMLNTLIECGAEYRHILLHPGLGIADLTNFIELFGSGHLDKKICGMPLISALFVGYNSGERSLMTLNKIKLLVEHGVDINGMHSKDGTVLHLIIANETTPSGTLKVIELLEELRLQGRSQFDYTLQDSEGKTPLLTAVKLSQNLVIKSFAKLHKSGLHIGLDTPDNEGRTPLLIAAALGNKEVVELLLELGADIDATDHQGRDISFYMSASDETVSAILRSIHVEPGRDANAKSNWLIFNDSFARPLAYDKSNEPEKRVLLSRNPENWKMIQEVYREAVSTDQGLADHIMRQLKALKESEGITVLERCLKGQKAVRAFINAYQGQLLRNASALGDAQTVAALIERGVDTEARDDLQRTALHYAVMRGELVQQILQKMKSTRTLEECMQGHVNVFSLLINAGANAFAKNKNNNTPVDIVRRDASSKFSANATCHDQKAAKALFNLLATHHESVLLGVVGFFCSNEEQKKWNELLSRQSEASFSQERSGPGYGF